MRKSLSVLISLTLPMLGLTSLSQTATASTLTFDNIGTCFLSCQYKQNGFAVTPLGGGDFGSAIAPDVLHFDILGGPFTNLVEITNLGGRQFSFSALDILPYAPLSTASPADPFVRISGYLNGSVVSTALAGNQAGGATTYALGQGFSRIDRVVIQGFLSMGIPVVSGADYHFDIDNLQLAVVPLPLSAPLLSAGLLGLVMVRRRRSRTTA